MANAMPAIYARQFNDSEPPSQAYLDESNVANILAVTGAFGFAALVVVGLRLYVRALMLQFVGMDDWAMLAAAMMALATFICLCGESTLGMGRHSEWQQRWMLEPYMQWLFAHGLLIMWGVVLVKISIAFFLMRIMLQKPWRIFLWCSVAFLACFALACTSTLVFGCIPISANWNFTIRMNPSTRCFSNQTYGFIGLFNSIINILTDCLFALLPVPVVLRLQVNRRTKASLIVVLSLGFIACIAGILKARLQTKVTTTPDQQFENDFQIWYMLELCLGILAASLPTLKPLFSAVLDGTRSKLGTRSRSRGTGANANGGLSRSHTSRLRPQCGPTSFPDPVEEVDLRQMKKGSTSGTTTAEAASVAGSSDVDAGKSPYDVRVTGGPVADERYQWESVETMRCGSEERLHHPASGIYKRVEMTHTSETCEVINEDRVTALGLR